MLYMKLANQMGKEIVQIVRCDVRIPASVKASIAYKLVSVDQ